MKQSNTFWSLVKKLGKLLERRQRAGFVVFLLILGIEKRTSAETLMSVNPSAHKSRYIQLSGFTQGRLRRSLAHITTVLFATSFSCRSLCFALNFSLTSVREAIKMR